jgi:hypothetical protein
MILEDAILVVAGSEPNTTIQAAINAAAANTKGAAVLVPSWYTGTDTYTNTSNVYVLDLRPTSKQTSGWNIPNAGTISAAAVVTSNMRAVSAGVASVVTAAVGGVFANAAGTQITPVLPGNSAWEQVPFVVKAAGYITAPIGTYTVTIQPLMYASTTLNFTAAASNAIYSAAAVSCTVTSASAISIPYEIESHLIGDTVSGKCSGWNQGFLPAAGNTIAGAVISPTIISNALSSVSFTATTGALAFAFGMTIGGGAPSGPTINMNSFYISQA